MITLPDEFRLGFGEMVIIQRVIVEKPELAGIFRCFLLDLVRDHLSMLSGLRLN